MYGEDIEAMRNFSTPHIYLEVKGDHLELRPIGFFGRIIRYLGLGYKNTTLEKVTEYLANNITDWAITRDAYKPIKRLVKRIRKAHRINQNRFPEHVKKIEENFKLITRDEAPISIHHMTNAEVLENMENLTIGEFSELPYRRVWEIFIRPMHIPSRLIALLEPEIDDDIPLLKVEEVKEEERRHTPRKATPRENSEAVALSIASDMNEYFDWSKNMDNPQSMEDSLEMEGSFSDPLSSSVVNLNS